MHYVHLGNCIHIINIQGSSSWLFLHVEYDIEPVWGTDWLDLLDYHPLKKEYISCDGLCHSKFNSGNCSHKSHIRLMNWPNDSQQSQSTLTGNT